MPGKGRDNKVSPRLSEDQNNFHSTNGEKHEENVKLSKNAIESLVENNEVEAQKEIRGKSTETCEESPAGIDDDKMNESINDTNTTNTSHGKSNELPPTCKSCFIAFAEKKSPACNHQFCLKCYKKLEKQKICAEDNKRFVEKPSEDIWEFQCSLCSKTCETSKQSKDEPNAQPILLVKDVTVKEILGKGVKKVGFANLEFPHFDLKEDFKFHSFAISCFGRVAAIDQFKKEVKVFDPNGKEESTFQFLSSHDFQGGLVFSRNELLLIGLKGEKYSCVAFYQTNGKFEYSAFLDDDFAAQRIIPINDNLPHHQEFLVIDGTKKGVAVISKEKLVDQKIELKTTPAFKTMALAISREGIYSLSNENGSLSLKLAHNFEGNTQTTEINLNMKDIKFTDTVLMFDDNGNIIFFDKSAKSIYHLSNDGKLITCLLTFKAPDDMNFSVIDILVNEQELKVLTKFSKTEIQQLYQLNSFTFSTPGKYKKHKEIQEGSEISMRRSPRCIIL